MGRVYKKKAAQYAKENGEGKDSSFENSVNADEKRSGPSPLNSDAEESIESSNWRTPKSTPILDEKANEDDAVIDDSDSVGKRGDRDSGDDKSENGEPEESSPGSKKGAQKRRASGRSKVVGADADEDDENGPSPPKKTSSKKNAGKKGKAKPKSKKQKVEEESDADEGKDDVDEDEKDKSKGKNDEDDADENDEDETEYEVKEVIDHKVEKGVSYYKIRWKGYSPDDDTWEEERSLTCKDLIDKFNKKKKSKTTNNTTNAKVSKSKPGAGKRGRPSGKKFEEDPEKQWEVDKIVDYSDEKKERVFRIRWKGYSAKFDTWEPEANLNCEELIQKFLKKIESEKHISVKELREEPKKTKRMVSEVFLKAERGARKSKRASGKQRVQYADSD